MTNLLVPPANTGQPIGGRRSNSGRVVIRLGFLVMAGTALALSLTWPGPDAALLAVSAGFLLLIAVAVVPPRGELRPITALDPALGIAFLFGVVVPLQNVFFGRPDIGIRASSSAEAAVEAQSIALCFFASVLAGWWILRPSTDPPRRITWPNRSYAVFLIVVGSAGYVIRAGVGTENVSTFLGLVSTLATPLLAVGSFLVLSEVRVGPRLVLACVLIPLSVLALLSYSLNRAVFVVPLMAMFIALVRAGRVRRVARTGLVLMGLAIAFFLVVGLVRVENQRQQYGDAVDRQSGAEVASVSLQVYGQSPYMTGNALDSPYAVSFGPKTFMASALSPVPILGEQFRGQNGTRLYNQQLGRGRASDQIIPIWLEAFLSGGLALCVLSGLIAGRLLRRCDEVMRRSRRVTSVYAAALTALWIAQSLTVSVLVLSQVAIYFVLPIVALTWVSRGSGGTTKITTTSVTSSVE